MNKSKTLKGIVAYPITPFDAAGNVDISLFKQLTDRLVTSGSHAIAPLGSTGVLPYLNDDEKEAVVEATLEIVAGRVPVLAGVSNLTTERTIYHARFAEKAGATAGDERSLWAACRRIAPLVQRAAARKQQAGERAADGSIFIAAADLD